VETLGILFSVLVANNDNYQPNYQKSKQRYTLESSNDSDTSVVFQTYSAHFFTKCQLLNCIIFIYGIEEAIITYISKRSGNTWKMYYFVLFL